MELQPSTGDPLSPFVGLFGRRQVRQLDAFLQPLRTLERRGAHGHRRVFLSDLFVAQLLAFYHPTVRSLRTLDALSRTAAARSVLKVERLPRGTVRDAHASSSPASPPAPSNPNPPQPPYALSRFQHEIPDAIG